MTIKRNKFNKKFLIIEIYNKTNLYKYNKIIPILNNKIIIIRFCNNK